VVARRNFNVIAIDDDEVTLKFYRDYFAANDITLVTALTGDEGLSRLDGASFDVVILDLRLGPDDGRRVLGEVVKRHPRTKIILVTAHSDDDIQRELLALGAFAVLRKPCTMRSVYECAETAAMTV